MLRVLGISLLENVGFTKFQFHVFWSIWNSYPSFWRNSYGKINVRRFLISDFLCFQDFIISNYQKSGILNFKNSKSGHLRFPKFRNFWSSEFFEISFPIFSRDVPWFFLDLIQVILFNKMKKYGLPEPKTLIIHEMLSFRCLMPRNRDFISLPWRRKIRLRH